MEKNKSGAFSSVKAIKEFENVQVMEFDNSFYMVAGRRQIYLLGEDCNEWARRLTEEEIESLPFDIYWTGVETKKHEKKY